MRIQSVRFSDRLWRTVQEEARKDGISASQYIREATIVRAVWDRARDEGVHELGDRLYEIVREVLDDEDD